MTCPVLAISSSKAPSPVLLRAAAPEARPAIAHQPREWIDSTDGEIGIDFRDRLTHRGNEPHRIALRPDHEAKHRGSAEWVLDV